MAVQPCNTGEKAWLNAVADSSEEETYLRSLIKQHREVPTAAFQSTPSDKASQIQ